MDRSEIKKHLTWCVKKAMGLFVSLKLWIIATTTLLLVKGYVDATNWQVVVISIALGRAVLQAADQYQKVKSEFPPLD